MVRMNKKIVSLLIPVLFAAAIAGYLVFNSDTEAPIVFDGERAYLDVAKQLSFGPRIHDSAAKEEFIAWLTAELEKSGWEVSIQYGEMLGKPIKNIVATRGKESSELLLAAHYDSRLAADSDLDPGMRSQPVPGANDGASGVAVLLELSRVLPGDSIPVGLLFTDAEDNGRIPGWDWIMGSRYYASVMQIRPKAVIVVDMVGDKDLNIYREINSDPELTSQIWEVAKNLGYENYFINQPKHSILDDHIPFVEAGIPAVDIIDIEYPYWHTTQDTLDKISPQSLAAVGETLLQWILLQGGDSLQPTN